MSQSSRARFAGRYEKQFPVEQSDLLSALEHHFGERIWRLPDGGWEYNLTIGVHADQAKSVFRDLKELPQFAFDMLSSVTAVDWLDRREPRFDIVYQLLSLKLRHRLVVKVQVDEESPEVDSVRDLWPSANFLERETWDMYGVVFRGHGDLRRILMYDEFVGHPLRKDYSIHHKQPRVPLRLPELRNTSADMRRNELVTLPKRQKEVEGKLSPPGPSSGVGAR